MRLSGSAVTISSAARATGNQAWGLAAATRVMGAMTHPSELDARRDCGPECARRALSNSAKVR